MENIFLYTEIKFINNKIDSFNTSKSAYKAIDDAKKACIQRMKNVAIEFAKKSISVKIDEEKLFLSFNQFGCTNLYSYNIKCLILK